MSPFASHLLAAQLPPMSADERQRYLQGRSDWRDRDWQDHCGDPGCDHCTGYIPDGNPRVAAVRREVLEA